MDRKSSKIRNGTQQNSRERELPGHSLLYPLTYRRPQRIIEARQVCGDGNEQYETSAHATEFHRSVERQAHAHRS